MANNFFPQAAATICALSFASESSLTHFTSLLSTLCALMFYLHINKATSSLQLETAEAKNGN
jgi:hypothetical protein